MPKWLSLRQERRGGLRARHLGKGSRRVLTHGWFDSDSAFASSSSVQTAQLGNGGLLEDGWERGSHESLGDEDDLLAKGEAILGEPGELPRAPSPSSASGDTAAGLDVLAKGKFGADDDAPKEAWNLAAASEDGTSTNAYMASSSRDPVASAGFRSREPLAAPPQVTSARLGEKRWDVVAIDCFIDKGVTPESCRSREFLANLRILVRRGGKLAHHMWHTSPYESQVSSQFFDTLALYEEIFGKDQVVVRQIQRPADIAFDSVIEVNT